MTSLDKQLASLDRKLREVGMKLEIIGRRINRGLDFSLSLPDDRSTGVIKVFHGKGAKHVKLTVVGASKKHRQIVLRVEEKERVIKETARRTYIDKTKRGLSDWRRFITDKMVLPTETKYSREYAEIVKDVDKDGKPVRDWNGHQQWVHVVNVKAVVPATDLYFLIGFDEDDTFISLLPDVVTSVEGAHALLMPYEVKRAMVDGREVMRSGEFFLLEATEADDRLITEKLAEAIVDKRFHAVTPYNTRTWFHFEDKDGKHRTDHVPILSVIADKKTYVTGGIGNKRHVLVFDGWYRMVRNTEIEPPETEQPQRRNWD